MTDQKVEEKRILKCLRCGWEWFPRVELPACCSACKSYSWNKPREGAKP